MKFSIITPSFRRKEKLEKAVLSVLAQTYSDWEMIIVNDSPNDKEYNLFASSINDARIHYHKNDHNMGKNFSCNVALRKVSADSKWIVFLDDDDYFSPDTLSTLHQLIMRHGNEKWFVTNRALKNGAPLTKVPKDNTRYSYARDYLILKRLRGDATHCIETKLITHVHAQFSRYVKQGEEWFFFFQIGLHTKLFYNDHNSTITDGYDMVNGLNFRRRSFSERFESITALFYEGLEKKILYKPSFVIYILIRYAKLLLDILNPRSYANKRA
jgi:glycosyltransferase involved in cell wall biosynthesis